MNIFIEKNKKNMEIDFSGSAKDILEKLGINSESIIIVKNGEVVTEDALLENSDKIEFLSVVSGG